jgi:methyl-accepting chemotaxis protein
LIALFKRVRIPTCLALLFNDPQAASSTLSALRNSPNVASAGILTADRRSFAEYTTEGGDEILNIPGLPANQVEGYRFRRTHVVLIRKILSEAKLVGFIYIRADLREIQRRLWRCALISIGVLLISLLFAIFVSSRFRKSLAEPIVVLADAARKVSRDRDYSVRVLTNGQRDELGTLMNSFNEMLREIQQRVAWPARRR